jgi:hypothetical protein
MSVDTAYVSKSFHNDPEAWERWPQLQLALGVCSGVQRWTARKLAASFLGMLSVSPRPTPATTLPKWFERARWPINWSGHLAPRFGITTNGLNWNHTGFRHDGAV